jgi:hypothetical protein
LLLRCLPIALAAIGLGCSGSSKATTDPTEVPDASEPDAAGDDARTDQEPLEGANPEASDELLVVLPAQFTQESMPMRMLADGDPVDLWSAPQGGHVVLFGAKVKNMTSDVATLRVRFRRPETGHIEAEEGRSVKMVPVPGEPGTLQPDIRTFSQVANVPLCPSIANAGVVDQTFDVEVFVTALYTQPVETGTAHVKVVARCSTPSEEAFCRCECGPDYVLGKCFETGDGGSDGPAPREASLPGDPPDGATE